MQLDRQFWEKSPSEMVRRWAGTVPTKLLLKTCTYLGQCRQVNVVDNRLTNVHTGGWGGGGGKPAATARTTTH